MAIIEVIISGIPKVTTKLDAIDAASDPDRIVNEAGTLLLGRVLNRYQAQTDPDGVKWEPSKAALIRQAGGYTWSNGKKVTGGFTLYATGRLFKSIQLVSRGIGERAIKTDVPYAREHNEGIPPQQKRTFLGFSDEDVNVVGALVLNRVKRAVNA